MKASASHLAAVGLAALVSISTLRADAVDDARVALSTGDFAAMKTGLDAFLLTHPADARAGALRAFARLGLAAETDVPLFLKTKLGASRATINIDPSGEENEDDIEFPVVYRYEDAPRWIVTNGNYSLPPGGDFEDAYISFANTAKTGSYSLVLALNYARHPANSLYLNFYIGGDQAGVFEYFGTEFHGGSHHEGLVIDEPGHRITLVIPAGSVASIHGYQFGPGSLAPTTPPPASIKVLNGKRVEGDAPVLAPTANFNDFLAFSATLDAGTIAEVVKDLSLADATFSLILAPEETGHPQDIVIGYADIQILLAEIKFLQGLRLLGTNYNLGLKLNSSLFDTEALQILAKNPALFGSKGNSAALAANRTNARACFEQATVHYDNASDAGLWTRPTPETGTHLFAIAPEDVESAEEEKLSVDLAVSQFRTALFGPVPLIELSDSFAEDPNIPEDAALSFAPFFATAPLNVRLLLPAFAEDGIRRGTSAKLITSGLFPGLGTAAWEDFLLHAELSDESASAVQSPPKIYTQPAKLVTVAEHGAAQFSVVAESYPAPTFQWYRGSGLTATPIPEQTGRTLSLTDVSRTDAGTYTVRVTNSRVLPPRITPTVTTLASSPAKLVVTYGPEITASPAPRTVLAGRPTKFTAAAVGVPAPTYQWYKGETLIKGAKAATYSISAVTAGSAGDYSVRATSGAVTQGTTPVALIVHEKPRFTLKPVARTVVAGADVVFTVAVAGNPAPTLQWFKNNLPLDGQTGASLVLNDVVAGLDGPAGTYHVVATNTTVNAAGTDTQINAVPSVKVKLVVKP